MTVLVLFGRDTIMTFKGPSGFTINARTHDQQGEPYTQYKRPRSLGDWADQYDCLAGREAGIKLAQVRARRPSACRITCRGEAHTRTLGTDCHICRTVTRMTPSHTGWCITVHARCHAGKTKNFCSPCRTWYFPRLVCCGMSQVQGQLVFAGNVELYGRPEGLRSVQNVACTRGLRWTVCHYHRSAAT